MADSRTYRSHRFIVACLLASSSMFATEVSEAANWQICNRTAEPMWVAIAYDPGNGRHISEGWWKLNACGGCADLGSYNLRNVWYHAHNRNSSRVVAGDDLFCTNSPEAFTIDNQAVCHLRPGEWDTKGFRSVILRGENFTSNITGSAANGGVCID